MLFDSRTLVWVFPFVILSFGLGSSLQAQEKKRPSVKPLERPLENRTEPKPSTDNAKPLPARELKGSNVPWVEESDLPIDSWEVLYVKNSPVGVRHLQVVLSNVETLSKTKLVESKSESTLRLSMKGEILEQKVIVETTEELDGKLNAVKATFRIGESETKLQGEAKGNNQFILRVTKDGAEPVTKTIEWSKESRGPFALEQSLRRNPMEKGESRVIKYLDPVFADIAQTELRAFGMIKTPSLDGRVVELMEIECITRLGDNGLRNIVWVDGKGSTEKTYISFLDLRGFKCNEAEAKRIEDAGALDLYVIKPIVVSKRSTPILPQDSSVEYSVSMKNDDPVLLLSKQSNQIPGSKS